MITVAEWNQVQNVTTDSNLVTQIVPIQVQNVPVDFNLDIQVELIEMQNTNSIRGSNSYTTACNCATTSCIDDDCSERNPRNRILRSRCPDD
jgi:hypothetical protein